MLETDKVKCRGQNIHYLQKNAINSAQDISVNNL